MIEIDELENLIDLLAICITDKDKVGVDDTGLDIINEIEKIMKKYGEE